MENKKEPIFIFDLDQTTIDSTHRVGHGSLTSWVRNATRENIMKDKLLFLSQFISILDKHGYKVIICTSRVMSKWDWEFLYSKMNIPSHVKVIHRAEGDTRQDDKYKNTRLAYLNNFIQYKNRWKILIDDREDVRKAFSNLGRKCKAWDIPKATEKMLSEFWVRG